MPDAHAKLGPSGAHRWLACTASPTFEAQFPSSTSVFAAEGTLAHSFCELAVRHRFQGLSDEAYEAGTAELRKDPLYSPEMERTTGFYLDYIIEAANDFASLPFVVAETRVDISEYVPESFGTCDCILIGGDRLHIVDYKHGRGVKVSSIDNPQMKLYALGAWLKYGFLFSVKTVRMAIVQPRISEDVEEYEMPLEALLAWADSIRPVAQEAFNGPGTFVPGEHCRFCAGRSQCRARAAQYTKAYDDFKDLLLPETAGGQEQGPKLSDKEIAGILERVKDMARWADDLQAYLTGRILGGASVEGWKVVEGRTKRVIKDPQAASEALVRLLGASEEQIYKPRELRSMTELEKALGKKAVHAVIDPMLYKPPGKPTLVRDTDPRDPYTAAEADFKGLEGGGPDGSDD